MAKQRSRLHEMKSGRPAIGTGKGNGPTGKVSVARALERAANATKGARPGPIKGPAGQDGNVRSGGDFATSGSFGCVRGYNIGD
jgi:hypothetical protein